MDKNELKKAIMERLEEKIDDDQLEDVAGGRLVYAIDDDSRVNPRARYAYALARIDDLDEERLAGLDLRLMPPKFSNPDELEAFLGFKKVGSDTKIIL